MMVKPTLIKEHLAWYTMRHTSITDLGRDLCLDWSTPKAH